MPRQLPIKRKSASSAAIDSLFDNQPSTSSTESTPSTSLNPTPQPPSEFQTPPPTPPLTPSPTPSQPTDIRRIKDRLAKLLRLGEDSAASEGEVENALRIATELMAKHNLNRADIDTSQMDATQRIIIDKNIAFSKGRDITAWEKMLVNFIKAFIGTVEVYITTRVPLRRNGIAMLDESGDIRTGCIITFYGPVDDAEIAVEMFTEIRDDISRMSIIRWGGWARGDGASYAIGFAKGMQDQHQKATQNLLHSSNNSLILLSQKNTLAIRSKAQEWLSTQGVRITKKKSRITTRINQNAYDSGKQDGSRYNPSRPTATRKIG